MTVGAILSDPDYPDLKRYVLEHTGLKYFADKDEDFAARLARRINGTNAESCSSYLATLHRSGLGSREMAALVGELTIGETYFFRQPEHFELLRSTILPDLFRRNADRRQLRIWSAGCATGAEPFSLALLLQKEFADRAYGWDVLILGTDINEEFLTQARAGVFSEWALRDVSPDVKDCCFQKDGRRWILNSEICDAVVFRYHNLADDADLPSPDGVPFDLILCRNVLIYFSQERIREVSSNFYKWLAEGGWLLVGHAETSVENFALFELVVSPNITAYRRPLEGEEFTPPTSWTPFSELSSASVVADPATVAEPSEPTPPVSDSRSTDPAELIREARLLADRGDWQQAEAICRSRLAKDPLDPSAHFTLGMILNHNDSPEEAAAALRKAIYVDGEFVLAYYHLGTILQASGRSEEARKAFQNVVSLLTRRPPEEPLEHGDGITAAELQELARMHQGMLDVR